MPRIFIESIDDPRLAPYRDLADTGGPDDARFVVEGETLVERLIASEVEVDSLLVNPIGDTKFSGRVALNVPRIAASQFSSAVSPPSLRTARVAVPPRPSSRSTTRPIPYF